MRVLVACEFSGRVRDAFARRGHDSWSCDLLPSLTPGQHIQGDVIPVLAQHWDLVIAHPPCTFLCVSGARWWAKRTQEQSQAVQFVQACWAHGAVRCALENPIGCLSRLWRKPDQIIHPWQHGHGEVKATCLWLRGLPLLIPSAIVAGREPRIHYMAPGPDRSKRRSLTYEGVAEAMAHQWGSGIESA